MSVIDSLRGVLLLRGPRRRAAEWHRARTFRRAMQEYVQSPDALLAGNDALLERLMYGWGNIAYASRHEYLLASLKAARDARGPILECGSGLSTLLVGAMAKHHGRTLVSLENHPFWGERVSGALKDYGLDNVLLDVHPLRSYGEFEWYDPALDHFPGSFALVLCDGPHGRTPGGRYGCVPVMRERLAPGCVLILDDAEREDERIIADRWAAEVGSQWHMHGTQKPYIEMTWPGPVSATRRSVAG